jgi:hypothetical protein
LTPAEQTKIKTINRLKSMYALRAEVDKMYAAGEDATSTGKPVAWVMLGQWAEPILTAGKLRQRLCRRRQGCALS